MMDQNKKEFQVVLTFVIFIYFVIIVSLSSIQDIIVYENGIYYSGKFAKFEDMDTVNKVGRNGVQVQMQKKGFGDSFYMSKIVEEKEFIALVKKKVKLAKKEKRRQERLNKSKSKKEA